MHRARAATDARLSPGSAPGESAAAALLDHAPFTPFMEPRTARAPGLMPLGSDPLLLVLADCPAQMRMRDRLIEERPEVVHALLPEAEAGAAELFDLISAEAARTPGFAVEAEGWRRPDGVRVALDAAAPLMSLGRLVAEDWCILTPDPDRGEYRLTGAILCFPSRWVLAEKLARPLTAIHDPVPDYDDDLARRVNRVFETLRPGRDLWRVNWLVHPSPEPHQPGRKAADIGRAPVSDRLYLRTERQTLSRLPRSGAVAFGIRTSICPLEALSPDQAASLGRELARLDPASVAYRSGARLRDVAVARLGEISGQAGGAAAV